MGNEEIDLTVSGTSLNLDAERMVDDLASAAEWQGNLPFVGIHSVSPKPDDIDDALAGSFRIKDERFTLAPPIDWWDEPYRAPGERGFFQNSFSFADPLLSDPRFAEVLLPLATVIADWLSANPQDGALHRHRYAWHDHAAAGRIVVIAYVLREGVRRESLPSTLAKNLAAGVLEHGEYLMADANYAPNNHGLFSDAALALAARSLSPSPTVGRWIEVAERRFATVLGQTVDQEEAVHLEHSPSYHWIIHGALTRFAQAGLFEGLGLADLAQRMEDSGAWLVAPDGTLPPLGDTPIGRRPSAATVTASEALKGIRVFSAAGYAVVREADSALFVTAAHHPTAHKHADDGSFCLYEEGRALILDSGDPGYEYESAEFRYGTSPAAHATVCIDGFDWAKESPPYGSGMVSSAERDGIYALLTCNPGAVPGGGAATRFLLYAPGRFLVAIDTVEETGEQELVRTLPLAPDLDATPTSSGTEIRRNGDTVARLVQLPGPEGPEADRLTLARAQRSPQMRGFCFPSPGVSQPRCDIQLCGEASHPRALVLLLGNMLAVHPLIKWRGTTTKHGVEIEGLTQSPIVARVDEGSISHGCAG